MVNLLEYARQAYKHQHSNFFNRLNNLNKRPIFFIFLVSQIIFASDPVLVQGLPKQLHLFGIGQTPSLPDIGVLEKLLKNSRQKTIIKPEVTQPLIIIKDSTKTNNPGSNLSFDEIKEQSNKVLKPKQELNQFKKKLQESGSSKLKE